MSLQIFWVVYIKVKLMYSLYFLLYKQKEIHFNIEKNTVHLERCKTLNYEQVYLYIDVV